MYESNPKASLFREHEKRYKFKKSKPNEVDLSAVVDFSNHSAHPGVVAHTPLDVQLDLSRPLADRCPAVFSIEGVPGFYFLQNPFAEAEQLHFTERCLCEYPRPPNPTNITNLARIDGRLPPELPRNTPLAFTPDLRWATIGYHHNWDTRVYDPSHHSPVPPDLERLAGDLAQALVRATGQPLPHAFKAEAGIINWYNKDSTLAGHVDDSEICLHNPIVTVSFGCSAIFMLAPTKTDPPVAVLLRSGDVCFMGGASRLAVHGVPRILAGTCPVGLWRADRLPADRAHLHDVMLDRRIN
eukprot:EG_transcript_21494